MPIALRLYALRSWRRACAGLEHVTDGSSFFDSKKLRTVPPLREAMVFASGGGRSGPSAWWVISTCDLETMLEIDEARFFSGKSEVQSGDASFDEEFIIRAENKALIADIFSDAEMRDAVRALYKRGTVGGLRLDRSGRATIRFDLSTRDPSEARSAMLAFVSFLDLLADQVEDV